MYRYTGNSNFSVNSSDPDSEPQTAHVTELSSYDSDNVPFTERDAYRRRKMESRSRRQRSVAPDPIEFHDVDSLHAPSPPHEPQDVAAHDFLAAPEIITSSGRNSGESKVPGEGEGKSDDADDMAGSVHMQFDFPAAAVVIETVLKSSDTGAYSVEERLLLYITFFLTNGFTCKLPDFDFPKLALDMHNLWDSFTPNGFRDMVAKLRRPDLHVSSAPVSLSESVREAENVQEQSGGRQSPVQQEEDRDDVFIGIENINDAANEYRDATELRPSARQESALSDVDDNEPVIVDRPSNLLQQAIDDGREQIAMRAAIEQQEAKAYEDEEEDGENIETGSVSVATRRSAQHGSLFPLLSGDASDNDSDTTTSDSKSVSHTTVSDGKTVSHVSHGSSSSESTDVISDSKSDSRAPESPEEESLQEGASQVPDEPRRQEPQPETRRRGYIVLAVDDGSKWATRATMRAQYWTRRLASMREQGTLTEDDWDGSPITAKQWNEKTGSPTLRAMFTRDRLVEYQAYRRELLRESRNGSQNNSGGQVAPERVSNELPVIPFDPKVRRSRKRSGVQHQSLPINTNPRFKRGPVIMDDRMDFGSSMSGYTLREILDKTNLAKWTRKGRGLLEKNFHTLIVNPKSIPVVGEDPGDIHLLSTTTAKICLRTLLFFANPSYGDPLVPGISNVVFQIGFEDIFNLFRFQPQFIPSKFIDLFTGSASTYDLSTGKRWTKTGTPRRFASFVDTWTRKIKTFGDDFKQMILVLNGFIQFQVADETYNAFVTGKPESSILSLFNPDDMGGTVALLVNLGIPVDSILEIITTIKLTFEENIDYFMRHALHRLTARQDV